MSLPDVCPLDDKPCKGRECHLYCVEWRTQEPLCLVGYRSTGKIGAGKAYFEDNYAEETFKKLRKQPDPGKQTVPVKDEKGENPAEKKRRKFKPWPEFPVSKHTGEASEESHNGKLRAWETVRPDEGLKPEESGRIGEAIRYNEAEKTPLRSKARLKGAPADKKELPVKKPPQFKERVVSKDIHTTIISSVTEPDKEQEKRRKINKIMELDLPDASEEEFWS